MAIATTGAPPAIAHAIAETRRAYLGLSLATLGWASAFIAGKFVLAEMTPLAAATWRYAIATLVLLPFAVRAGRERRATPRGGHAGLSAAIVPLGLMVLFGGVAYPWLFLGALARTSATNTSLLIALNPVLTLVLTPIIGEPFERRRLIGAAIAFAGAVLVISGGHPSRLAGLELNTGDLLALIAAGCWAIFNIASRPVVGRLAPSIVNSIIYTGGFFALLFLARGEHPLGQLLGASWLAIAGIAAMALLSSVLAGQFFLIGVRTAGVGAAVVFVYLVPVLTAVLSAAILGEHLTIAQAAGGSAVLGGLWLATRVGIA